MTIQYHKFSLISFENFLIYSVSGWRSYNTIIVIKQNLDYFARNFMLNFCLLGSLFCFKMNLSFKLDLQ